MPEWAMWFLIIAVMSWVCGRGRCTVHLSRASRRPLRDDWSDPTLHRDAEPVPPATRSTLGEAPLGGTSTLLGGTPTLLFTGLVGYAAYVEQHGDERALALVQAHDRCVQQWAARHGAAEIQRLLDGFMLAFPSAKAALRCAAQIQSRLVEDNFPLELRMGLHAGEVLHEGEVWMGHAVNLARRLMQEADAGQILISTAVKDLAGSLDGFEFIDQGTRRLTGFNQPQQLYAFRAIEALNSPLDSELDRRLRALERQMES